jgi:predicted nucleic acid-binding protein
VTSWVLDASAVAGALLDPSGHAAVVDLVADEANDLAVPCLCDVEVLSVLRSVLRRGESDADRMSDAIAVLIDLPLRRFDHALLIERAFALRDNFTAYDAVYVALAEGLGATLVTADGRLATAARRWTRVEVMEA